MRRLVPVFGVLLLLVTAGAHAATADTAPKLQLDVKEFTLKNGMLFLVVERPATPQVAVRLAIRAGSALEERGKTGIAHQLEHMMFKGTKNFGSTDYRKDAELQQRIDAAYAAVKTEQARRNPDATLIREKVAEMERLRGEAQALYIPQVFSSQLGKNGAVGVNAFTSQDQTQYIASVPADMIEQWFSIASEQLFEPSWREFYVERDVVQREWDFRYVNNPEGAAWLDLNANAYTAHPYRNPVIGWKSDMERFSTQDAMEFHSRYYNPANAVCVLAGDVTLAEARRLAETYFERYPAGRRAPEIVTAEPGQQGPRRSVRFLEGARTPVVRIGFHGAPMTSPDFFALDALTMVLSEGRSARLTQRITNQGLAVEAWAGNPDNRFGGMVVLGGSPNEPEALSGKKVPEADARSAYAAACDELERLLLAEVEKLKSEPVSQEELDRLKKLNQRGFIDRLRKNESVAGTLATLEVQVGWRYLNDYLRKIEAVSPEDIQRVARRYLTAENRTTAYVIPAGEPVRPPEPYTEVRSITGSAAMARARSKPPELSNHSVYPTPAGWKHPLSFDRKPQRVDYPDAERLAIGDTPIFYLADRELPLVDMTIYLKAGSVDLKDSEAGLTDLLDSTLVRGGTGTHPPVELAVLLDDNALRLSVDIGLEETAIRLSTLTPDWEKGLAVLKDVLTHPRFDAKILSVTKDQQIVALRRQGEDASDVAMREAMIRHFKGHPYGRDPLAELNTLPSITRDDLLRFLRAYVVPSNMVVALAGDIGRDDARESLARFFKDLPDGRAPERQVPAPPATPPGVTLIHKPGQVQSKIVAVLPGVRRVDPEFWKLNLLMNIFGGSDSLLYTRLRDDLGIVYSAGFYQSARWEAGLLVGVIGCKGDQAAEAMLETVRIMNRLQAEVPAEELKQKRLDALNSFVFNVDTQAELVRAYSRYTLRQEPLDTLERIQAAYVSARADELQRLSDRFLRPQRLQINIVADKTIPIRKGDGITLSLGENLKAMATALGLPFEEIELR
jgi:predicted Zn-dependent peptidase